MRTEEQRQPRREKSMGKIEHHHQTKDYSIYICTNVYASLLLPFIDHHTESPSYNEKTDKNEFQWFCIIRKREALLTAKANLYPAFRHHQHQHISDPKLLWTV